MMSEDSIRDNLAKKRKELKENLNMVRQKITGNEKVEDSKVSERIRDKIENINEDKGLVRQKVSDYEPGRNIAKIIKGGDEEESKTKESENKHETSTRKTPTKKPNKPSVSSTSGDIRKRKPVISRERQKPDKNEEPEPEEEKKVVL